MEGELSVVSKQKQYSLNKVPILVEGDIATDMEEVKKSFTYTEFRWLQK